MGFFAVTRAMPGSGTLLTNAGFDEISVRTDRQRPSLGKLAHHARMLWLLRVLRRFNLAEAALPFRIPLPGIALVTAKKPRADEPVT